MIDNGKLTLMQRSNQRTIDRYQLNISNTISP
jgi:hypothetical protein